MKLYLPSFCDFFQKNFKPISVLTTWSVVLDPNALLLVACGQFQATFAAVRDVIRAAHGSGWVVGAMLRGTDAVRAAGPFVQLAKSAITTIGSHTGICNRKRWSINRTPSPCSGVAERPAKWGCWVWGVQPPPPYVNKNFLGLPPLCFLNFCPLRIFFSIFFLNIFFWFFSLCPEKWGYCSILSTPVPRLLLWVVRRSWPIHMVRIIYSTTEWIPSVIFGD